MSVIRILPSEISNRIAAGEVIERPASVVKELLENSLDAGASRVSVLISQGGRNSIQVSDNGCGMDRDDALLCLEAHATSKIRESQDIERIRTLGFRGEAVPSIASVSLFQLQTRQEEHVAGTEVLVDGGTIREVRECGCAPGTSIRVRNLFAHLPARRKFLRGQATEEAHIQEVVLLQALAHPGVAFELKAEGRTLLKVNATEDGAARIGMLLGRSIFDSLLPVDYEEAGVRVRGFVARPGVTRSTRREQRIFVNGRPASASMIYLGIRDAYQSLVVKGRYPAVVLYLELPPDHVDVNVHPAKREVRFRDERLVGQITAAAVRKALRAPVLEATPSLADEARPGDAPAPSFPTPRIFQPPSQPHLDLPPVVSPARPVMSAPVSGVPPVSLAPEAPAHFADSAPPPDMASLPPPETETACGAATLASRHSASSPSGQAAPVPPPVSAVPEMPPPAVSSEEEIRSLEIQGTLAGRYLIALGQRGLVLVDQRAAHERVLFERLLAVAKERDGKSQPLLLPVTVELSPADAVLLKKNLAHFQCFGFGVEEFGGQTFLVTAVPPHFPQDNLAGLLRNVLDDVRQSPGMTRRGDEVQVARAACRCAVSADSVLAPVEQRQLLNDLAGTEMPYTCPRGRPVMINISLAELEKRFGRRA
jgi:DNA mismatch repair protein MutL